MMLFLLPQKYNVKAWTDIFNKPDYVHTLLPLTAYQIPLTTAFDLLKGIYFR